MVTPALKLPPLAHLDPLNLNPLNPRKRCRDELLVADGLPSIPHLFIPSPAILGPVEESALRQHAAPSTPALVDLFFSDVASNESSVSGGDVAAIASVVEFAQVQEQVLPTAAASCLPCPPPALEPLPVHIGSGWTTTTTTVPKSVAAVHALAASSDSECSAESLTRPVKRAKAASADRFTCKVCDTGFALRCDLRRHVRTVHEGRKIYDCPYPTCTKSFGHSGHLNRHILSVHKRVRRHKCTHLNCGDAFFQASHLQSHVKHVHERQKPWACDLCDVRLATESGLRNHLRNAHADQATFTCAHKGCGKQFVLATDLSRHCNKAHPQ